ncbi:hypothetical protein QJS10_CPB13g01187 [Acorus calamus]|uniref:Uncharacterized protein n=1 Tax=Acorus calamus TaxID=4465 RepID=A0AAV9DJ07_ACOCL|nr:hypothetical protein QJS10_CPB13g01187 [Acorus calamus]
MGCAPHHIPTWGGGEGHMWVRGGVRDVFPTAAASASSRVGGDPPGEDPCETGFVSYN